MASVKRFEDLVCWQKARELTKFTYGITKGEQFAKDYGLKDQIQRASVSVMSNIAEGFERGTKDEFLYFLYIAKASAGEARAQLYVAYDLRYITEAALREGLAKAKRVSAIIYHFIEGLKVSKFKGLRQKRGNAENNDFQQELLKYLPQDHPLRKLNS